MALNPEQVGDQVTTDALAEFLNRDGRVLLSEDFGEPYTRMRKAIAVVLTHLATQPTETLGQHLADITPTPADLRIDPDKRVDAAYQRGFTAGRATVASEPVESVLGAQVDEELRAEHLATLRAQRRHAEVGAESVLDVADLTRRAADLARDDVEHRRSLDADRVTPAYVVRRDAVFAAIAHADTRCRAAASVDAVEGTTRESIMDAVPWWAAQLAPFDRPAPVESARAVMFADQLIAAAGGLEGVDSIHDSTTWGAFRVILNNETILDVSVSEAAAGE